MGTLTLQSNAPNLALHPFLNEQLFRMKLSQLGTDATVGGPERTTGDRYVPVWYMFLSDA
jgi:hypothetical protein